MRVLMHRAAHLLVCGRHGHGEVQERLDSGQDDGLQRTRVCVWGWQLLWNMCCNSSCILSHRYLHPLTAPTELPDFPHSSSLLEPGTSLLFVPNILME